MSMIKVDIFPEENKISVWNNGKGIPVVVHKEHNCYVPELIFSQLLTSSNYDDKQKKVTGGRNGFGAKLANVFSKRFVIETADSENEYLYYQEFKNNMSVKGEPVLTENRKRSDYTCVTFYPDLTRFNMQSLDKDIVDLMKKRVYDLAGITDRRVKIKLNGNLLDIKTFNDYTDLYLKKEAELPKVIAKPNDRW